MKYFKIRMNQSSLIVPDIHDVKEEIENLEIGDELRIKAIEMTKEEFESMSEFKGF